jgi:hypothetical protein
MELYARRSLGYRRFSNSYVRIVSAKGYHVLTIPVRDCQTVGLDPRLLRPGPALSLRLQACAHSTTMGPVLSPKAIKNLRRDYSFVPPGRCTSSFLRFASRR